MCQCVKGSESFGIDSGVRQVYHECARVLHETLLMPVLMYGSETMIEKEKRGLGLGLFKWTTSEVC